MEMPSPQNRKELQAFLGIINYLGKFYPSTVNICEPPQKLISSRAVWSRNALYQTLYYKAKSLIQKDIYMKFYDETKPLYPKTLTSGIGHGAALLQTRDGTTWSKDAVPDSTILRTITFASKTTAEQRYSNIEREA